MDELLAAIDEALERQGISASAASRAAVGNPSLVKNLRASREDKSRKHPFENIKALAEVLGLEVYIGPPRHDTNTISVDPETSPDFALVPSYKVDASAGPGATAVDTSLDGAMAFRKDWLSSRGISTANAVLLRARGDSMQPVIWHGDLLLVDQSKTLPPVRDPKAVSLRKGYQEDVYVVELGGDLLVKAVRRPSEDRLVLVSENSHRYDPEVLKGEEINDLRIVGKVLWWGHSAEGG